MESPPTGGAAGFPWGDNSPTRSQRFLFAAAIAVIAATLHYFRAAEVGGRSDFSPLWHAARLMLEGRNPYDLIGPGNVVESNWPIFYPATAFVAAIPFVILPFHWASTLFVFLSAGLLAYGCTVDGWHRTPIFPSIAFLTSVQLGQFSTIMTAALFIPWLAVLSAVKPQAALPVIASSIKSASYLAGAAGGALLIAISLVMLPSWPGDWLSLLKTTNNFGPPILHFPGPAIALVLLRWRRPEAWLVFVAACVPQTWFPYNGLFLIAVGATYRESCVLSVVSSAGWMLSAFLFENKTQVEIRVIMQQVLIVACYFPAAVIVLRRPNEGGGPLWLRYILGSGR